MSTLEAFREYSAPALGEALFRLDPEHGDPETTATHQIAEEELAAWHEAARGIGMSDEDFEAWCAEIRDGPMPTDADGELFIDTAKGHETYIARRGIVPRLPETSN